MQYDNFTARRKGEAIELINSMSRMMYAIGILFFLITMPFAGIIFSVSGAIIRILGFIIDGIPVSSGLPQHVLEKKRFFGFALFKDVTNDFCKKLALTKVSVNINIRRANNNRARRSLARPAFATSGGGDSDDGDGGDSSGDSYSLNLCPKDQKPLSGNHSVRLFLSNNSSKNNYLAPSLSHLFLLGEVG